MNRKNMRRNFQRTRENRTHHSMFHCFFLVPYFYTRRCNEIRTRCLSKLNWSWFFVVSSLMALSESGADTFSNDGCVCVHVSPKHRVCICLCEYACVCECVYRARTQIHIGAVLVKMCCTPTVCAVHTLCTGCVSC